MKKAKLKPIKKIMIFAIITVMIVSLFAVPAFAFTMQAPTGTITLPSSLSGDTDLIGGCAVTFDFSTLASEVYSYGGSNVIVFDTDNMAHCQVATRSIGLSLDNLTYKECTKIIYNRQYGRFEFYDYSNSPYETLYTDTNVRELVLMMSDNTKAVWEVEVTGFMQSATYSVSTIVSASPPTPSFTFPTPTIDYVLPHSVYEQDNALVGSTVIRLSRSTLTDYVRANVTNNATVYDYGPADNMSVSVGNYYYSSVTEVVVYKEQYLDITYLQDGVTPFTTSWDFENLDYINFYFADYPPAEIDTTDTAQSSFWALADTAYTAVAPDEPTDPDNPDNPDTPTDGNGIFEVWTSITQWIVNGLSNVQNAFISNGELTLLGYLALIPVGLAVAFLLLALIQKFLRLRG